MADTKVAKAGVDVPLYINGIEKLSGKTFDVISPVTGKVIHKAAAVNVEEAGQAVAAAAEAFKSWQKAAPTQRRDIFLKAADIVQKRSAELIQYMVEETGSADPWAQFNVMLCAETLKDCAGRIATLEGSVPTIADPNRSAIVVQEPYGVVLSVVPWNAPYILAMRALASPIAAGNTVVFKASERSPRVMWAVVDIFHEAGLPNGVLNMVTHDPADALAVTTALISNKHVKKINFTGSTNVGRIVGKLAGENLKPIVMELGGKAPAIVWEDADLGLAADQCALGSFMHGGQICMSTERIIVHKNVSDKFREAFAASCEKMFSSKGEAPILINSAAVERNLQLVRDATSKGAKVVVGDPDVQEASNTRLHAIVLDKVTPEMDIYQTESFGPTVSLIEVETEEEALRIANDTDYGLASSIFTEDLARGLRLARQIETGAVHINSMSVHDESALPHGGAKSSGYGRFNASRGLNEWVRSKNITFRN